MMTVWQAQAQAQAQVAGRGPQATGAFGLVNLLFGALRTFFKMKFANMSERWWSCGSSQKTNPSLFSFIVQFFVATSNPITLEWAQEDEHMT
jgi:hypothetical protein